MKKSGIAAIAVVVLALDVWLLWTMWPSLMHRPTHEFGPDFMEQETAPPPNPYLEELKSVPYSTNDVEGMAEYLFKLVPSDLIIAPEKGLSGEDYVRIFGQGMDTVYSTVTFSKWKTEDGQGYRVPLEAVDAALGQMFMRHDLEPLKGTDAYDEDSQTIYLLEEQVGLSPSFQVSLVEKNGPYTDATARRLFKNLGRSYDDNEVYEFVAVISDGDWSMKRIMQFAIVDDIALITSVSTM